MVPAPQLPSSAASQLRSQPSCSQAHVGDDRVGEAIGLQELLPVDGHGIVRVENGPDGLHCAAHRLQLL
eukprot:7022521-Prymnesium_polylepis.1